jgi:hypothetical protein
MKQENRKEIYTKYSITQLDVYMLVYKIHSVVMHTHECVCKANCKSSSIFLMLQTQQLTTRTASTNQEHPKSNYTVCML